MYRTLYHSRRWDEKRGTYYESPMVDLVKTIETLATQQGLSLYRWQTASRHNGHIVTITWGLHRGSRPRYSRDCNGTTVTLSQIEGKTQACEAYKRLLTLLPNLLK